MFEPVILFIHFTFLAGGFITKVGFDTKRKRVRLQTKGPEFEPMYPKLVVVLIIFEPSRNYITLP